MYNPTSPNNFNNIKITERQKNKKNNHVIIIGVLFNSLTKPLKSNKIKSNKIEKKSKTLNLV
tara:strand:+ start:199 stop:384 length:186 start_codon:yes stop_codon:yes gene_type:complete